MQEEKNQPVQIKPEWCKACGICYSICPKGALDKDHLGKVIVRDQSLCSRCRLCEEHCPDYCIKIGGKDS